MPRTSAILRSIVVSVALTVMLTLMVNPGLRQQVMDRFGASGGGGSTSRGTGKVTPGVGPSPAPGNVEPTVGTTTQPDRKGAVTRAEVVQIAKDACPAALDVGTCTQEVVVAPLGGPAGLTSIQSEEQWDAATGVRTSKLWASKVTLDPILLDTNPTYVRHIAAHEWNHVEQANIAGTPAAYKAMQERANAYFQPRAKVSLRGTSTGMELLTDCMTVFQDKTLAGPGRDGLTAYVEQYMTSKTMEAACGDGWQDLLRK